MSQLAKNLRVLRKRALLSQNNVAKTIGVKRSSYAYYESGKTEPKLDNLVKISDLYNVTVDELLGDLSSASSNVKTLNASIPQYSDMEGYKVYDKFNDLSEYEKMAVLNIRLMSPEQKDELIKFIDSLKNQND